MERKLKSNERKCKQCGAIIKYSVRDAKAGNIPDYPVCPMCSKKVTRGEVQTNRFKPENTFAELVEVKTDEDQPKKRRRFGKDEVDE